MIKSCIFDLDGVITDTAKYHYIAWKALADELGFEFTQAHNERLKGVSRMRSLDILLEIGNLTFPNAQKEEFAKRKNELYLTFILKMTPAEILPGVTELLKELRALGVKVALGSASKNAVTILKQLQLMNMFDAIVDGNMVSEAKPNPEVFIKAADMTGTKPENCLVFEDAEAGVEAAINGNMKCIGIGSPDILNKANHVLTGLENISYAKLSELIN